MAAAFHSSAFRSSPFPVREAVELIAVEDSGSPDDDSWGDTWTDNAAPTDTHGADTALVATDTGQEVLIEVDLTAYAGATATANVHYLQLTATHTAGAEPPDLVAAALVSETRPFVESTVDHESAPGAELFTIDLSGATVVEDGADQVIEVPISRSALQQMLGLWVCFKFGISDGTLSIVSREDATAADRPMLHFTYRPAP